MPLTRRDTSANSLLADLPSTSLAHVLASCESIDLISQICYACRVIGFATYTFPLTASSRWWLRSMATPDWKSA